MTAKITITRLADGNSVVEGTFDAHSDLMYVLHHLVIVVARNCDKTPPEVVALLAQGIDATFDEESVFPTPGSTH